MSRTRCARRCAVVPARTHCSNSRCSAAVRSIHVVGPGTAKLLLPTLWSTVPSERLLPEEGGSLTSTDDGSPLRAGSAVGTLPNMPPAKRRPDISWLPVLLPNVQALLDQGGSTRGCTATVRGGHIIVGRVDEHGADPRFRLTLLRGDTYGLSLYHHKKWDLLPFEGTPSQLVDVMNTALAHWATDWSLPDL